MATDTPPGSPAEAPDALLLMAPGCAYCPQVLAALGELLEDGVIGRLEAVSIVAHPEAAREAGTRSVPWTRIGRFELQGNHGKEELSRWAKRATHGDGMGAWYSELLENGQLPRAEERLRRHPEELGELLGLLHQDQTPIAVRIGISAIMEGLEDTDRLRALVPELVSLTRSSTPAIRADACHYLGMSADPRATEVLKGLLDDESGQVREVAREALQVLSRHEGRTAPGN